MKKKKVVKRKNYPTKLRVVIFKAQHHEYRRMAAQAKKQTDGNLSALIRLKVLGKSTKKAS